MHPQFAELTPRWFKRAFVYTGSIGEFRFTSPCTPSSAMSWRGMWRSRISLGTTTGSSSCKAGSSPATTPIAPTTPDRPPYSRTDAASWPRPFFIQRSRHTLRLSSASIGISSRRPVSISSDSTTLLSGERMEKFSMGPRIPRPGPTLLMQVKDAAKDS